MVDIDATEKQVEKIQAYISKFKPFQLHTEYNTVTVSIDDVEELESVDLLESVDEFVDNLKLEEEKQKRVQQIIKELYAKNKV